MQSALEDMRGVAGEAEARADHHERQHTDLMGAWQCRESVDTTKLPTYLITCIAELGTGQA